MAATITPDFAAQLRPLALTVTSGMVGARLAFAGGPEHHTITVPMTPDHDGALEFIDLATAQLIRREAIGATAALLARVFGERA